MGLVEEKVRAQIRKGVLIQTKTPGPVRSTQGTKLGVCPGRDIPQLPSYCSQLKSPPFPDILENAEEHRENVNSQISCEDKQSETNGKEQVDCCSIEHYSALEGGSNST